MNIPMIFPSIAAPGFFVNLDADKWEDIGRATLDTLLMVGGALPPALALGLPLGIALVFMQHIAIAPPSPGVHPAGTGSESITLGALYHFDDHNDPSHLADHGDLTRHPWCNPAASHRCSTVLRTPPRRKRATRRLIVVSSKLHKRWEQPPGNSSGGSCYQKHAPV